MQNPPLIFAYLIRGEPRMGTDQTTSNSLPQKLPRQMVNFGSNLAERQGLQASSKR